MRVMEIPPFPREIEIPDLDYFVRARLSQTVVMWPEQSIPLLGYMCCPNDAEARAPLLRMLRTWQNGSRNDQPPLLRKLGRIQHNWLRVADVFHVHSDLISGEHQERRGGPSIGKAITLVEANARSRGTGARIFGKSGRPTRTWPTSSPPRRWSSHRPERWLAANHSARLA
jgi:hypothetical protein